MLLDTSVWIEFLIGSEKGLKVKKLLYEELTLYTCPITLAEISVWCYKNNEDPEPYLQTIKKFSKKLDISDDIYVASGAIYVQERKKRDKLGLIDCIIYATAQSHGLDLLTKDSDFKGLKDVTIL